MGHKTQTPGCGTAGGLEPVDQQGARITLQDSDFPRNLNLDDTRIGSKRYVLKRSTSKQISRLPQVIRASHQGGRWMTVWRVTPRKIGLPVFAPDGFRLNPGDEGVARQIWRHAISRRTSRDWTIPSAMTGDAQ